MTDKQEKNGKETDDKDVQPKPQSGPKKTRDMEPRPGRGGYLTR